MGILINDDDTCKCGAYWNSNNYWCTNGHPRGYEFKCKCGGEFKAGRDEWNSRMRCDKCNDYFDLSG